MGQATSPTPVRGMRDFLPAQLRRRNAVLSTIRQMVTARGFMEIETPAVEDIRRLRSKQGGENESMLFEILGRGLDREVPVAPAESIDSGLRYDLTLPLSRYYANNHADLPAEVRIFQTGPVWRAERPQKGRFRQFNQCDIDIIGCAGPAAEVEVLSVGLSVIDALGLSDRATLHINDRRLLDALMQACSIAEDKRGSVLIELDKLDKMPADKVTESIANIDGVGADAATLLMKAVSVLGDITVEEGMTEVVVDGLENPVPLFDIALVMQQLKALGSAARIVFDPCLVRGMGYYTGLIYEVKLDGTTSSVCGGGRYDGMIGRWLGKDVPAVGFSFGFERLIDLVESVSSLPTLVAIGYRSEEDHLAAIQLASELAKSGTPCGLVKVPKKIKGSFFDGLVDNYASIIMPDLLALEPSEALASAKELAK